MGGQCEAVVVVGGGKKAKRRGLPFAKWHCAKCRISGWFKENLKDACEKKEPAAQPRPEHRWPVRVVDVPQTSNVGGDGYRYAPVTVRKEPWV